MQEQPKYKALLECKVVIRKGLASDFQQDVIVVDVMRRREEKKTKLVSL